MDNTTQIKIGMDLRDRLIALRGQWHLRSMDAVIRRLLETPSTAPTDKRGKSA